MRYLPTKGAIIKEVILAIIAGGVTWYTINKLKAYNDKKGV